MIQISKRLVPFVWYAAPLNLTTNFAWKGRIKILRRINPAGAGYVSFDPTRPANSLTVLNTGDSLTLDATGVVASDPDTFFFLDNGNLPLPLPFPDTMILTVPSGPAGRTLDFVAQRVGKPVFVQAESSSAASQALFSVNGGPYLSDYDASIAIEALPAGTFSSSGPGCTLQPRIRTLTDSSSDEERRFTIQQTTY